MPKASVSRVTISPPVGMYLPGMERTENSHGLRDELYATALAFEADGDEVVIVSCDVLALHPETVFRVRQQASSLTGIRPGNIMLCATHCHSGPVTYALPDSRPMYKAYAKNLEFQLVGLIRMALEGLSPARINFDIGHSSIGINRRLTMEDGTTVISANPDGPTDPEVGVLRVDTVDGTPLAIMVNYACHPVVLGNGSNVISADWPGAMRRTVEAETGALTVFIQGGCADVNPMPGEPSDDEELLEQLGLEIGNEVLRVWSGITPKDFHTLDAKSNKLHLPLLPASQHNGVLPEFIELAQAVEGLSQQELESWLHDRAPWKADIVGKGDDRRAEMELQAMRIGHVGLASAAGEIFVQTGMRVKMNSPFKDTIFAGYANGLVCYIPPPEEYERGGYEVEEVYIAYRLPAPPAPEAAGMIEEGAVQLLHDLSANK